MESIRAFAGKETVSAFVPQLLGIVGAGDRRLPVNEAIRVHGFGNKFTCEMIDIKSRRITSASSNAQSPCVACADKRLKYRID